MQTHSAHFIDIPAIRKVHCCQIVPITYNDIQAIEKVMLWKTLHVTIPARCNYVSYYHGKIAVPTFIMITG